MKIKKQVAKCVNPHEERNEHMKKSQKIILAVCLAVSVIAIVAIVCILARRPEPIEDNIGGNVNNSGDLVTSSGDEMYLNVTKKVGDIEISDIKITLIEKNNCRIEAKVKNTGDKFLESTNIEIKAIDGVRYTVPSTIHVDNMADLLTVRFRVGGVFKNIWRLSNSPCTTRREHVCNICAIRYKRRT